jgi:hypothetical protein
MRDGSCSIHLSRLSTEAARCNTIWSVREWKTRLQFRSSVSIYATILCRPTRQCLYNIFVDIWSLVDPRLGWFLMELPATLSFLLTFWRGKHSVSDIVRIASQAKSRTKLFVNFTTKGKPMPMFLAAIFLRHYLNRSFSLDLHCINTSPRSKSSCHQRGWYFPLSIRTTEGQQSTFQVHVLRAILR